MSASTDRLLEIVNALPPDLRREVEDFAAFVAERAKERNGGSTTGCTGRRLSLEGWSGCLSHVEKSGVDLQHESTQQRAQSARKDSRDVSGGQ